MADKKCNIWEIIDAWLQRVALLFGIITGVFVVIFTWKQVEINKKLGQDEHLLQQPIFQVQSDITKSEGSDIFDHEDIEIYNHGEIVKDIESVRLDSYIRFVYSPNIIKQQRDTFYVPVYYFGVKYTTYNLKGLIAFTQTTEPNWAQYVELCREVQKSSEYPIVAEVDKVTFVSINYVDKLDKFHTVVFMNGKSVNENLKASIKEQNEALNNYKVWEFSDLSFDKLKEICRCD